MEVIGSAFCGFGSITHPIPTPKALPKVPPNGVPKAIKTSAPTKEITKKPLEIDKDCPVCFNIMIEPCRIPKCKHVFCVSCVEQFIQQKFACPLDRQPFDHNFKPTVDKQLQALIK